MAAKPITISPIAIIRLAANVYSHIVIATDIARHVMSIIKSTIRMCFLRVKKPRLHRRGRGVTNQGAGLVRRVAS